jgi:hypothetical protein
MSWITLEEDVHGTLQSTYTRTGSLQTSDTTGTIPNSATTLIYAAHTTFMKQLLLLTNS